MKKAVSCENNFFMRNRSTNAHFMETWQNGDMAFFAYDGSWRFPSHEFHEIKLNVMKNALRCVSWNSLKDIFHSVSSPFSNKGNNFVFSIKENILVRLKVGWLNMAVRINTSSWKDDLYIMQQLKEHNSKGISLQEILSYMKRNFSQHQ